jgi:DNA-binding response OmpR family regulator
MKILVVEDDAIMLASIEHQLKQEGFQVVTADNGREAMLAFENDSPDLVVTDILMPLTSGLEFLGLIRSGTVKIPVLVLSALDEEDTVVEAFNLGADDFLTKPVKPGELSTRVKRLLKRIGKLQKK